MCHHLNFGYVDGVCLVDRCPVSLTTFMERIERALVLREEGLCFETIVFEDPVVAKVIEKECRSSPTSYSYLFNLKKACFDCFTSIHRYDCDDCDKEFCIVPKGFSCGYNLDSFECPLHAVYNLYPRPIGAGDLDYNGHILLDSSRYRDTKIRAIYEGYIQSDELFTINQIKSALFYLRPERVLIDSDELVKVPTFDTEIAKYLRSWLT